MKNFMKRLISIALAILSLLVILWLMIFCAKVMAFIFVTMVVVGGLGLAIIMIQESIYHWLFERK